MEKCNTPGKQNDMDQQSAKCLGNLVNFVTITNENHNKIVEFQLPVWEPNPATEENTSIIGQEGKMSFAQSRYLNAQLMIGVMNIYGDKILI